MRTSLLGHRYQAALLKILQFRAKGIFPAPPVTEGFGLLLPCAYPLYLLQTLTILWMTTARVSHVTNQCMSNSTCIKVIIAIDVISCPDPNKGEEGRPRRDSWAFTCTYNTLNRSVVTITLLSDFLSLMAFREVEAPSFTHMVLKEQVVGYLLENTSPSTLLSASIKHAGFWEVMRKCHQYHQMGCYMDDVKHPLSGHGLVHPRCHIRCTATQASI